MAILTSDSLNGCTSIPDFIPSGTRMTFCSTNAPTSWTKRTDHNNKALRVVTGPAAPSGTSPFTTVFSFRPVSGSVTTASSSISISQTTISAPITQVNSYPTFSLNPVSLAVGQMASHDHTFVRIQRDTNRSGNTGTPSTLAGLDAFNTDQRSSIATSHTHTHPVGVQHGHQATVSAHGHTINSSGPHSHTITEIAQVFAVTYVDIIVCEKQ